MGRKDFCQILGSGVIKKMTDLPIDMMMKAARPRRGHECPYLYLVPSLSVGLSPLLSSQGNGCSGEVAWVDPQGSVASR